MDNRPVLKIPYSKFEKVIECGSILGVMFAIAVLVIKWHSLPASIPTHFALNGQPDGWGSKSTLLMFPVFCFIAYASLSLVQRFPHIYNYPVALTPENVETQYRLGRTMMGLIKIECVWMSALPVWQMASVALAKNQNLSVLPILFICFLMLPTSLVCIYKMYRAR